MCRLLRRRPVQLRTRPALVSVCSPAPQASLHWLTGRPTGAVYSMCVHRSARTPACCWQTASCRPRSARRCVPWEGRTSNAARCRQVGGWWWWWGGGGGHRCANGGAAPGSVRHPRQAWSRVQEAPSPPSRCPHAALTLPSRCAPGDETPLRTSWGTFLTGQVAVHPVRTREPLLPVVAAVVHACNELCAPSGVASQQVDDRPCTPRLGAACR